MKKILFQGDSITDARREGEGFGSALAALGTGYPALIGAELMRKDPSALVINRGVSGNRVVDMYARWKADCINLAPDVLTILIGVNDVWHERNWQNGVEAEKFEKIYRMLIEETLQKLPGIKIILMGAFLTEGTVAEGDDFKDFSEEVKTRRQITEKIAKEYGLAYIDLQKVFDDALELAPAEHWTAEGVHPLAAGNALIKEAWMSVYDGMTIEK